MLDSARSTNGSKPQNLIESSGAVTQSPGGKHISTEQNTDFTETEQHPARVENLISAVKIRNKFDLELEKKNRNHMFTSLT